MKKGTTLLRTLLLVLLGTMLGTQKMSAQEAYAAYDNGTLTFYYDTSRSSRGTTYDLNTGSNSPGWYLDGKYASVTKVHFDTSFGSARPTTTFRWFYMMENLTSITNTYYFNTSQVTSMQQMFYRCRNLTSAPTSYMTTGNVTNMMSMFDGCSKLSKLDLAKWNVSKVTNMAFMFENCTALTSINVLGWNTTSANTMLEMFMNCSSLTSLDLSSWSTSQVRDMMYMFKGCSSLTTINVGGNWSTIGLSVTGKKYVFSGCTSLVGGSGTTCDGTNHVDFDYAHLDGGDSNPGYMTAAPYALLSTDGTTLTFYNDGDYNKEGTFYGMYTSNSPLWYPIRANITTAVFDPSFSSARPTTTRQWFYGMTNLTNIVGLEYLNTSEVTTMWQMFADCNSLTTIDVRGFNTEKVTSMYGLFLGCKALTSIDVSGFNTSQVKDVRYMFSECYLLSSLNLLNFDTSNVDQGTMGMFRNCQSLTTLDLSSFDTRYAQAMNSMFSGCTNLTTIYVSDKWSTDGVTIPANATDLFSRCTSLVGGAGTACNGTSNLGKAYARIDGGSSAPGYFTDIAQRKMYAVYTAENTTLSFYCDGRRNNRTGTTFYDDFRTGQSSPYWDTDDTNKSVTKVVFDPSFSDARVTTTCLWFYDMTQLTSITGIQYLNTSEVTNMWRMFEGCNKLTSLDLSSFNTSNVTTMHEMFRDCTKLTSVGDLSGWDVGNLTGDYGMSNMFYNCQALQSLNLSGWNTSNISNMEYMFYFCYALTSLNLSGWKTENVTKMDYMFSNCKRLTSLDLSDFNTSKVTVMNSMFLGCSSLTSLDLRNFNTAKVTNMSSMFNGCTALETIYVGSGWSVTNVTGSTNMFNNCTSIKGGKGTIYDANHVDKEYARIDKGTSAPGYLTSGVTEAYAIWNETTQTLTHYYDHKKSERASEGQLIDGQGYETRDEQDYPMAFEDVLKVVYDQSVANFSPKGIICGGWYCGDLTNLTTIEGLEYIDTSEEHYFADMFSNCTYLASLDLSNFDTRKATNMSGMFAGCVALQSLTLGENWSTANVTNMSNMFSNNCSHHAIDVVTNHENFTTAKVTDMSYMFKANNRSNLLNLLMFNTAKVTNMKSMFYGSFSLTTIQVGTDWSTESVTNSTEMFTGCTNLVGGAGTGYDATHVTADYAHIDGGAGNPGYFTGIVYPPYAVYDETTTTLTFYADNKQDEKAGTVYHLPDSGETPAWYEGTVKTEITKAVFDKSFITARPTSTSQWFAEMLSLTEIEGLENLMTSEVTNLELMFGNCQSLYTLDLTTFDTQKVTNMSGMFWGCSTLETIYVGSTWTTASVTDGGGMFYNCPRLKGSAGTEWQETVHGGSVTNVISFAHVDGGMDNPGLLSGKAEAYAAYLSTNKTLTFYYDGSRLGRNAAIFSLNTGTNDPGWLGTNGGTYAQHVVFDSSFANARPTSTYRWFYNFPQLQDIIGMELLNTSEVTTMNQMFFRCNISFLDLSHFDTKKVTDMGGMFRNSTRLEDVNLSNFIIAQRMSFYNMFAGCTALKTLDLSSFNTEKVYNMTNMFNGCSALTTIYVSDDWDASRVTDQPIFTGCTSLVGGNGTHCDGENNLGRAYAIIDGKDGNPGYLTRAEPFPYVVLSEDGKTLTFYHDGHRGSKMGTIYNLNSGADYPDWVNLGSPTFIETVVFDPSFADARPTTTHSWFEQMHNLRTLTGVQYLNTSEVTDMGAMFWNCFSLTSMNISNFDTKKVTTMYGMFNGCSSILALDLSNFNTAEVTEMNNMFGECGALRLIYVGQGWNTDKVTVSDNMFDGCNAISGEKGTTYDPDHIDKAYAHVDEGASNPGYLTSAQAYVVYDNGTLSFFCDGCKGGHNGTIYDLNDEDSYPAWWRDGTHNDVTNVYIDPSFANARPISTLGWFHEMPVTMITGLEYLNTSEVTTMAYMFCGSDNKSIQLTSIDVTGFDVSKVTNMSYMFGYWSKLETIYCNDNWNTNTVTSSQYMFESCSSLKGGKGTEYNYGHIDKEYARPDGGSTNPGYFTTTYMVGDVNHDGDVNVADVTALVNMQKSGNVVYNEVADVDGDGSITNIDVKALVYNILGSYALMYVEDVFTITGRGTVATGQILKGMFRTGQTAVLRSISDAIADVEFSISGIEKFQQTVDVAVAGDNVGILVPVDKANVQRGDVLTIKNNPELRHGKTVKGTLYVLTKEEGGRHTSFSIGYRPQMYVAGADFTVECTDLGTVNGQAVDMVMPGSTSENVVIEVIEDGKTPYTYPGQVVYLREGGQTIGRLTITE